MTFPIQSTHPVPFQASIANGRGPAGVAVSSKHPATPPMAIANRRESTLSTYSVRTFFSALKRQLFGRKNGRGSHSSEDLGTHAHSSLVGGAQVRSQSTPLDAEAMELPTLVVTRPGARDVIALSSSSEACFGKQGVSIVVEEEEVEGVTVVVGGADSDSAIGNSSSNSSSVTGSPSSSNSSGEDEDEEESESANLGAKETLAFEEVLKANTGNPERPSILFRWGIINYAWGCGGLGGLGKGEWVAFFLDVMGSLSPRFINGVWAYASWCFLMMILCLYFVEKVRNTFLQRQRGS